MAEPTPPSAHPADERGAGRLDSWKEIAAYLKRDVTTVQRWERREGMPVHRHVHDRLGSVYAFKSEIDAWTRSRAPAPREASERDDQADVAGLSSAEASGEPTEAVSELPSESPRAAGADAPIAPTRSVRLIAWVAAACALLALGLTVSRAGWLSREQRVPEIAPAAARSTPAAAGVPSLAVLPFETEGSASEIVPLAGALSEELTNRLAGIRGLRVARASSLRASAWRAPAQTVARALGVDHLLKGRVAGSGDRVHLTVRLVDARNGAELWSRSFERRAGELAGAQEQIAFAVAAALNVSLAAADETRVRRSVTVDPEANRLYWIAHAHLHGRLRARDTELGKRLMEQAVARDPSFAAAHAGVARFYVHSVWHLSGDPEENTRLGTLAAERAVALDPSLSEALMARAGFLFVRHRFRGDYAAYVDAEQVMDRAIRADPANSAAFFDLCRMLIWTDPERALAMCERTLELDPIKSGPLSVIPSLLALRGQPAAARAHCAESARALRNESCRGEPSAAIEAYYGNFEAALRAPRAEQGPHRLASQIQRWSILMALGDRAAAEQSLDFGDFPLARTLSGAARHALHGRYDLAFAALDQRREQFPVTRLLDVPTAKFALLAGKPREARAILEARIPDVAMEIAPITGQNLLPALDLATAYEGSGARAEARALLSRIAAYLEDAPLRLPMIAFQRARTHALAGETDAALRALERAYDEGLRTTWAIDLRPQPLFYLDPIAADPAFRALRADPRFEAWLARLASDNARQREQLRAHQAADSS